MSYYELSFREHEPRSNIGFYRLQRQGQMHGACLTMNRHTRCATGLVLTGLIILLVGCEGPTHIHDPVIPVPWDSVSYNNIDSALLAPDRVEAFYKSYDTSTMLPVAFTRFPRLRKLLWVHGRLTQVPSFIDEMRSLQELYLFDNRISYVAPDIGTLSNLTILALRDNMITVLPNQLCDLSELRELYVYNNRLTSLPDSIHKLTKLRNLQIFGNRIGAREIQRIETALPNMTTFLHD